MLNINDHKNNYKIIIILPCLLFLLKISAFGRVLQFFNIMKIIFEHFEYCHVTCYMYYTTLLYNNYHNIQHIYKITIYYHIRMQISCYVKVYNTLYMRYYNYY